MIGGAPMIGGRQQKFNLKAHKEYASAMATGQNAPRPYPTHYTNVEGGEWQNFRASNSIKFSDGSIYDTKTGAWRKPEPVDPVLDWDNVCAGDPLASNKMVLAGNQMVDEIRKLRAKLLDLEQERRENSLVRIVDDDDERDF